MTASYDLLDSLRREWRRTGRSPRFRRSFARLVERHPELGLGELEDLGDVVDALERRSARTVLERAEIVRALLEEAADPCVHRALLQTLLPGVVSVCRQLRFGEGIVDEPRDTVSVAVSLLSELLVDWAGQSRQYAAPDVLSALRGRLRRWLMKEKAAAAATRRSVVDRPAIESSPLLTRLESLCDSEHARLARLTFARVFEGRSIRELAEDDHSAPVALQDELQRFALRHLL